MQSGIFFLHLVFLFLIWSMISIDVVSHGPLPFPETETI